MRNKLIALGVVFVFFSAAWAFFETPEPPIAGLVRPQIDEKLFEGAAAAPGTAGKTAADLRAQRMEQRKNIRAAAQDNGNKKEGFLSRFLHRNQNPNTNPAAGAGQSPKAAPGAANRLIKRDANVNKNKRDFLAKRREDRKAKREAMINAAKTHPTTLKAGGTGPGLNPESPNGDEQIPEEPLPPPEMEIEETPPDLPTGGENIHEDMPSEE